FQAEDGIRDRNVTGVQTCALPIFLCPTCKGARYHQDTLEVKFRDKNITEVLDLSVEEGVRFFADQPTIARKIAVMNELGLGYLRSEERRVGKGWQPRRWLTHYNIK